MAQSAVLKPAVIKREKPRAVAQGFPVEYQSNGWIN